MDASQNSPTQGLGKFIKENRFFVPTHQRDYSWEKTYVEQFIKDIEDSMSKSSKLYFFGLMVFTKADSSQLKVLDGQQRLATTLMIFSAIRNWFRLDTQFKELETKLQSHYLENSEFGDTIISSKLDLTPANNDMFRRYIIEPTHISAIENELKKRKDDDRNNTLLSSAIFVNRHIIKKADSFANANDAKTYFTNLVLFITNVVQIVTFIVSDDEAAYTIFETLNDRGLALSPLDLIKNYIFSRAEKHRAGSLREFEDRWSEMMVTLGNVRSDSFLRAFWTSKHGKYDGNKVFRLFKDENREPSDTYKISVDMLESSQRYASIFNSNDAIWSRYSEKTRQSVDALKVIDPTQMYPIILAAIGKFEAREMERLLRLLEVIAVRYQTIGKGRPGRMESLGGRAAILINDGKITSATDVLATLQELYVSDDVFKKDFTLKVLIDPKKARYILTRLERQSLLREGNSLPDELTPESATLEHIFPKSPGSGWETELQADPKLSRDCLNRLGNMCLLPEVNRALGNKTFSEKKHIFTQSRQRLTNKLVEHDQWGRSQITKRQEWMAELAVAEWRFQ